MSLMPLVLMAGLVAYRSLEFIYDEYVRPVFRRLHLDPETDVKDFFYWTKGEPAPPTTAKLPI